MLTLKGSNWQLKFLRRYYFYPANQRGTFYCWAWRKDNFETNKWAMFLETEATFPHCNWSIKMARMIGFGSASVVNSWQRLGRLPCWVYVKVGYSFKQKHSIKKKNICRNKFQKRLPQVWFASVFSQSSAVSCFPLRVMIEGPAEL